MDVKKLIARQKIAARKSIALTKLNMPKYPNEDFLLALKIIADEKSFINFGFDNVKTVDDLINIVHRFRHKNITKAGRHTRCKYCKNILAEMSTELPGAPFEIATPESNEQDILPRFGNLLAVLGQEVQDELDRIERVRMPSQNDLTRWALKSAVLAFYQNMNVAEDIPIVINRFDDRLITELSPDFDVIAQMWTQKLDELQRRDDKYALIIEEYDKAEGDLNDGMRGSAFEKQLDRYREEFMKRLAR